MSIGPPSVDPMTTGGSTQFSLLGPLEVRLRDLPVHVGPPRQRLVLAMLLCHANTPVPVERLSEALWPGEPPSNARKSLQVYVSNLRRELGPGSAAGGRRIAFSCAGYLISAAPGELDARRFDDLARDGVREVRRGELPAGVARLEQALALWRGPALAEFGHVKALRPAVGRMTRRRLSAVENWADAELALGNADAVVERLGELALEYPSRERLRALQMTALHRSGRPAEALAVHDEVRQMFAREFGLGPGSLIQNAHQELIAGGPGRPAPARAPAPASAAAGPTASAARPAVRSQLPDDLGDFTGRTEQVQQMLKAMDDGARSLVLCGQPGVGKTTLAVHVAHLLRPRFAGGSMFLRLRSADGAPRSLHSLLAELWYVADVSTAMPADPDTALAVWQAHLAERPLLLVLDDARDEERVRRLSPQTGRSATLTTSRSMLPALACTARVRVPAFAPDEAMELFERIVGRRRTGGAPAAARRVVESIGLLPLAIRAAGDKLNILRYLPLADYAARFESRHRRLDLLSVGDASVRRRLDAAIHDLPEQQRGALSRLSALPTAPFTLAYAADALGLGPAAACEFLEFLIEHSMITAPDLEIPAHVAEYELPPLLHLRLRESALESAADLSGVRTAEVGGAPQSARRDLAEQRN